MAPTTATPLIEGGATTEGAWRVAPFFRVADLVVVAVTSASDCTEADCPVVAVPLVEVVTVFDLDCCPGGVFWVAVSFGEEATASDWDCPGGEVGFCSSWALANGTPSTTKSTASASELSGVALMFPP